MAKHTKAASPVNGWPMKILAIVLALLFVFGIAWSVMENTGMFKRTTVTLESAHYKVDNAMLKYFYETEYASFLSEYSYYLSYFGLDTSKSLKTQEYSKGMTWYEYFLDAAINSAKNQMVLCEAALAAGREIGDKQKEEMAEAIQVIKDNAKSYNMSVNAYLSAMYGNGVKMSDIEKCLELSALAQVQYDAMIDSYEWTEEDYTKWAENKDNFSSIWFADYMSFTFEAKFDKDDDDETKSEARQAAEKLAKELAEKKTKDDFFKWIEDYEKKLQAEKDKDKKEEDKKEVTYKPEDYTTEKYGFDTESDLGKWIFAEDRAANDTTVIYDKEKETYTAYIALATKYRLEYDTVNIRHILIKVSSTAKDEVKKEAKKKADDILAEFLKGDNKTPEAFGELAKKHTEDSNADQGGLYEKVFKGDMVETFDAWIYDEARKPGDTGIVETDYGYHVMYFEGKDMTAWKVTADNGLTSKQYEDDYAKLEKAHSVEVDLNNAYKVEE